jgi:RNA-directed DNA polymerase
MASLTAFITHRLKLKVNHGKSAVARPWQRKFLGFSFTSEPQPYRRIAPQAVGRFKERVRELTGRPRGVSLTRTVEGLSLYLRRWQGYFGHCQTPSVLRDLEPWLRRRLRAVQWVHRKDGSRRYAELRKRGVWAEWAAKAASSAHGPWRLAHRKAVKIALSDGFFDSLGLTRLVVTERLNRPNRLRPRMSGGVAGARG